MSIHLYVQVYQNNVLTGDNDTLTGAVSVDGMEGYLVSPVSSQAVLRVRNGKDVAPLLAEIIKSHSGQDGLDDFLGVLAHIREVYAGDEWFMVSGLLAKVNTILDNE